MSLFRESIDRVNRSDSHAKSFVEMSRKFLHEKPYSVTHEMRKDRRGEGFIKAVLESPMNPDAPIALGEYFYQLQAALDATMWKAFTHFGGTEASPDAKGIYFPICDKASTFNQATFNTIPLSGKLKLWLRAVQPCFAKETCRTADEVAVSEALFLIRECAKADRHRQLHIIGCYPTGQTLSMEVRPAPASLAYLRTVQPVFFKNELVIAEFGIDDITPDTEIKAYGGMNLQISTHQIKPEPGADMARQLAHLRDVVLLVIQNFEDAIQ